MPRDLLQYLCAQGVIQSGCCRCSIRSILLAAPHKLDNETLATDHSSSFQLFKLFALTCLLNFDQRSTLTLLGSSLRVHPSLIIFDQTTRWVELPSN
jgi:hypothetical protein